MPGTEQGAFTAAISRLEALLDAGGIVMLPLFAVGLIAWFAIALRAMTLLEVKAAVDRPEAVAAIEALITGGQAGTNWDRGLSHLADWMVADPAAAEIRVDWSYQVCTVRSDPTRPRNSANRARMSREIRVVLPPGCW